MVSLKELYEALREDPWREQVGFSPDVEACHDRIWRASATPADVENEINAWLSRFQPCLFGRIAAKNDQLTLCILDENILTSSDDVIADRIQTARTTWTREAYEGKKSGFVILALSRRLACARPDQAARDFARRLGTLYLQLEQLDLNTIYHDDVFLEVPGRRQRTWKWKAGVNYFSTHADKRWWRDHCVPGGVAYSINSVGHMAKSGKLALALQQLYDSVGVSDVDRLPSNVESLEKALVLAMQTISLAAGTEYGKATELLTRSEDPDDDLPECPVTLPRQLADKNHCEYAGWYHTDFTLPEEYFREAAGRPEDSSPFRLDFTYLFMPGLDNPDHITMGTGRPIRAAEPSTKTDTKAVKIQPEEVNIGDCQRLDHALNRIEKGATRHPHD